MDPRDDTWIWVVYTLRLAAQDHTGHEVVAGPEDDTRMVQRVGFVGSSRQGNWARPQAHPQPRGVRRSRGQKREVGLRSEEIDVTDGGRDVD